MTDQRRNPDAEHIRELLDKAAPRNSDTSGRAEAVTRRAQRARTTRGVAGGIAVAAVVAAVIITPQFLNTSQTTNERNDPGNDVVADKGNVELPDGEGVLANPCPEQDGLSDVGNESVIAPGATSIRLCPILLSGGYVPPWDAPDDALVEVDGLYTLVAEGAPADPARCAATTPVPDPLYFQVVGSDGDVTTASSGSFCSDITVAGTAYPVGDVLDAFFASLAAQRLALSPRSVPSQVADCSEDITPGTDPEVDVPLTRGPRPTRDTRFSAFFTCGPEGPPEMAGEEAIAMLNGDWPSSTVDLVTEQPEDVDRCPTARVLTYPTYGVTTWGDVLEFAFRGCGNYLVRGYGGFDVPDAFGSPAVQFLPSEDLTEALGLY